MKQKINFLVKIAIASVAVLAVWEYLNSLTTIGTSGVGVVSVNADSSTFPPKVDMTAAQNFIRLGFGIDQSVQFQSTNLLTPPLTTAEAQQLISMVSSYNNFDGKKIAAALAEFQGQISSIQFGREGSPVIYIDLPYWTHQREGTNLSSRGERISYFDNRKLAKKIEQVFTSDLEADEFSANGRQLRIWWD